MLRVIAALLLAGTPALALAHAFSIVPLRIELGKTRTASLTITNDSVGRTFEVRAVRWTQDNGADTYEQTDELIAVPSTFRLEEGAAQVVRVSLNRDPDATEHAYRVFLTEVVPAPEVSEGSVVATALSVGIPVFLLPVGEGWLNGQLELKAERTDSGIRIDAQNTGVANVKTQEIVVEAAGRPLIRVTPGDYLLAGARRAWEYPLFQGFTGPLTVSVQTDRGTFTSKTR